MDSTSESAAKRRKPAEPYVRDSQYILQKHKGKAPSLVVHLHPTHFRFEGQDGSWAYDSPMKFILQHLKKQTVPHELMGELLAPNNVPWYDGCLIVEVHNHIAKAGKEKRRRDSGANDGNVKFSMHNYNEHVTPSPMAPFPSKARTDDTPEKAESSAADMPAPERPKDKEGPAITTLVLHPTSLSQHSELLLLMNTPADHVRGKKKANDSATPSSAQPPTPQLSVPPTPITQTSRGPLSQSQKMCLEQDDLYSFQADLLVATEPPLYLEPVDHPQDAEKVLEMLQHPMHQEKPPSPKTRKRTTAEVAADDAQAAEAERRMLIMDERIKPAGAGTGANENQAAAATLGFSRFKTIEMVRQKHEEAERIKKEEEARAMMEKKQAEEQNAVQQRQAQMAQRQREILLAQQQQQQPSQQNAAMQMRAEQMRAAQLRATQQQQAMLNAQSHGHPQQNNMMPNQQQGFQQTSQVSMAQSSPIVRQQTPLVNSSPMMPQAGFPMAQTSSQGAGSPPRPTSAVMQNPMARQVSQQQQQGSRNNTPQMPQGTPAMNQPMPNRQTTQTPRMPPGSPATSMQQQGTPVSVSMPMQNQHIASANQWSPEQMQMLAAQRALSQSQASGGMQAGSPVQNLTPDQISQIRSVGQQLVTLQQQHNHLISQAQAAGNLEMVQKLRMDLQQKQQMIKHRQNQMIQQAQQQNARMAGQAGSPGSMQHPTPQMGHAHPQQQQQQGNMQDPNQVSQQQHMQQMANAQARAQQLAMSRQQVQNSAQFQQAQHQLQSLVQQYNGIQNIPPQVINQLPAGAQQLLKQQFARQQQARQHQQMRVQAAQQQQQNNGGREQVPGSQPNPQYMQQLRDNQAMLQQQMQNPQNQQQQGGGGMNTLGMQSFTMNAMGGNNAFAGNQGQGGGDLSQQFAAMQNALNRSSSGQGMQ